MHNWGNGQKTWIATMYEKLDYEADNCRYNNNGDRANPLWADVERDAWMISGKHSFGNGFDIRFSYMDADELDCPGGVCGEPGFYSEYGEYANNTCLPQADQPESPLYPSAPGRAGVRRERGTGSQTPLTGDHGRPSSCFSDAVWREPLRFELIGRLSPLVARRSKLP